MKKAVIYSVAVCLVSWAYFSVLYFGFNIQSKILYMFLPMLVAAALQFIHKESFASTKLLKLKIDWTWLAALLLPVLAVALSILFSALMPGVRLHFGASQVVNQFGLDSATAEMLNSQLSSMPPAALILSSILSSLIAGATINAVFAFGEEYGWRNYMVASLDGMGFWKKALFIGFVWGIWHMPIILSGHNYPQHPVIGVGLMCIFCILTGVIELYLVLKSGSVFPAAIFHGTINALGGIVYLLVEGGNDITIGITGIAGFISMILIIASICIYDRYISKNSIL